MNKVKRDYATGNMSIRTTAKKKAASNMVLLGYCAGTLLVRLASRRFGPASVG
jgi:hypothetical protein